MLGITFGILLTIGTIWFLWISWKRAREIFHICFLLSVLMFGEAVMCFCLGIFGNKKQASQTNVEECVTRAEEDTSTYVILKIDTIFVGKKYNYNGELEYENR